MDYKTSGVDVEAGDNLVDWLQKTSTSKKHADKIVSGIGGFASLFRFQQNKFKKPCLVTCTDGVGTKVKLAAHFKKYDGVGQDLVAMCVNDLICCGGEPLLFLDYYAVGKLDLEAAKAFLQSVRSACEKSECALVGGETAEMPGVYQNDDFDCAGFCVGVVDEDETLGAHRVQVRDHVLGFASSGFHSNGYSLLRKVFEKDLDQWKDVLLEPTRLYVDLMKVLVEKKLVQAAAHITGGGIDNIPRSMPENTKLVLNHWPITMPFLEVQKRTGLSTEKMLRTLNGGIGFVVICRSEAVAEIKEISKAIGHECHELGVIESSNEKEPLVEWRG